jgi:hypothetical protein
MCHNTGTKDLEEETHSNSWFEISPAYELDEVLVGSHNPPLDRTVLEAARDSRVPVPVASDLSLSRNPKSPSQCNSGRAIPGRHTHTTIVISIGPHLNGSTYLSLSFSAGNTSQFSAAAIFVVAGQNRFESSSFPTRSLENLPKDLD